MIKYLIKTADASGGRFEHLIITLAAPPYILCFMKGVGIGLISQLYMFSY